MSRYKLVAQKFPIQCYGRDINSNAILKEPVNVTVLAHQRVGDETNISLVVENCPYNTGSHGQRCNASHPHVDKIDKTILCPYAADIPYSLEHRNKN